MNIQKIGRILAPFKTSTIWRKNAPLFDNSTANWDAGFRIVVLGVLLLGIVFRLGNLPAKPYWEDEVYTSTLVAGYEIESIEADLKDKLVSVSDLSKYQDVRLGQSWQETSVALAKRPEHPPLYFLLARAWAKCFGSSPGAMRAFPAATSLLTLPLFYWLARLLFNQSETAAVALCLACTSPIFIRFAQETRPYSLWVVGILLSSATLLHALKHNRRRNWAFYSASVALAILTNWLSSFVFLAHGCQVLMIKNSSWPAKRAITKRFLIALSVGLLPIIPWAGLLIYNRRSVHGVLRWLEQEKTFQELSTTWVANLSHLIFAELPSGNSWLLFVIPLLLLIIGSTVQLMAKSRIQQWLLPILLCVVPTVAFVTPDLLFGGGRSLISRYFLGADVGAILILGFGISANRSADKTKIKQVHWPKRVLFYAVLAISISACWSNFNANTWWGESDFSRKAASAIAQTSSSVDIYSDQRLSPFLSFTSSLRPTDRIMWLDEASPLPDKLFDDSRVVILFEPSDTLLSQVEKASALRGFDLVQQYLPGEVKRDDSQEKTRRRFFEVQHPPE